MRRIKSSGWAGMHSVTWDLNADGPRPRELGGPQSRDELREVLPGEYQVSLKIGDTTMKRTIVVENGWIERSPGRVR